MEDKELEALNAILAEGRNEQPSQEQEQNQEVPQEGTPQEEMQQGQEPQGQGQENKTEINIDDLDLSSLGITADTENEQQGQEQESQHQQNDPATQEILKKLDSMQGQNKDTQDPATQEINEEELGPLRELAEKMQRAGLIQGMSDEDRQLLEEAKSMKERLELEDQSRAEIEEHQSKVAALDDFNTKLERTIPNYDSDLMKKTVADIAQKHPQAAEEILNNPMQLLQLWEQLGVKAQPKQQDTNVISSNTKQPTMQNDNLDKKVKSGEASEEEEAMWLLNSFQ